MPTPISDIMANYMPGPNGDEDGFIIVTGGCDTPKGNERANFGDGDLFACFVSGNKAYKFDPFTQKFVGTIPDLPHERQRHGGAVIDGELYLIGGRDSNDTLVAAIDVRI